MLRARDDHPALAGAAAKELAEAARAMRSVREKWKELGLSPRGRSSPLDGERQRTIRRVTESSALLGAVQRSWEIPKESLNAMMERFEEIARRCEMEIPGHLRPAIYKLLSVELANNIAAFKVTPKQRPNLIPATLLHGDMTGLPGRSINNDRSQPTYGRFFEDSPGIFKRAIINHPADPAASLDALAGRVLAMEKEHDVHGKGMLNRGDLITAAEHYSGDLRQRYLHDLAQKRQKNGNGHAGKVKKESAAAARA